MLATADKLDESDDNVDHYLVVKVVEAFKVKVTVKTKVSLVRVRNV